MRTYGTRRSGPRVFGYLVATLLVASGLVLGWQEARRRRRSGSTTDARQRGMGSAQRREGRHHPKRPVELRKGQTRAGAH